MCNIAGARGIAASGATQQPQSLDTLPSDANRMQKVSLTSSEALPGDRKDQAQASAAAPASNLPAKVNPQPEVVAFTDPKVDLEPPKFCMDIFCKSHGKKVLRN